MLDWFTVQSALMSSAGPVATPMRRPPATVLENESRRSTRPSTSIDRNDGGRAESCGAGGGNGRGRVWDGGQYATAGSCCISTPHRTRRAFPLSFPRAAAPSLTPQNVRCQYASSSMISRPCARATAYSAARRGADMVTPVGLPPVGVRYSRRGFGCGPVHARSRSSNARGSAPSASVGTCVRTDGRETERGGGGVGKRGRNRRPSLRCSACGKRGLWVLSFTRSRNATTARPVPLPAAARSPTPTRTSTMRQPIESRTDSAPA